MDSSGIAFCYDKKIISETSVAWAIHVELITQRLAGRQHRALSMVLEDH